MAGEAGSTGGGAAIALALAALALLSAVVSGCGGSSSEAADQSSGGSTAASGTSEPSPGFAATAKLPSFGEEASSGELGQASQTLERFQAARSAGNQEIQCETLARPVVETLEEEGGGKSCAEVLAEEAKTVPPALLAHTLVSPLSALRTKGINGYALYHDSSDGKEYAAQMQQENGEWMVVSLHNEEMR